MGQKVHPIGLRLGIHRKWKSSWYFDFHNYTKFLHINFDIEKFFKGFLYYYPIKTLLINCQIIKLPSNTLYIFIFFYRLRRKKKKTKKIFKLNTINIELPKKKIIQYSNLNKLKKLNQNLNCLNCLNFNKLNSIILNKNINQFDINNNLKDIKNYIKILLLLNANKRKVFNNFRYQRLVKVFFNKIEHKVQILLINLKNVIYYYKIINNLKKKNKNFNIENNKYLINLYTNKVLYNLEYINYIIKKDFDKFNYYDLFLVLASDYINTLSKSKINYKNLINKKKYNRNIFKYINKEKLKKKIFLKKNLYSNIKDIKIFLSKLTNSKVNIIFINALSFSKFYYYLPKKDNKSVEQPNFLLGIEQQIINIYKYNAIYVKDLINIAFISILFKNSEFLAKFIGFQFKKTPKNKKQTKLIQLINQVVSLFAFRRKEIVGLKLKFKGRINRRKRAKSIIINKGILSLQTTETRVEYGYSEGYTRYGLIGIKIWIFYEKAFKNEFKNFFYKYIKYSQKKVELEQC